MVVTAKLTRLQAGLLALEDAPFMGCEIIRRCGDYVWIRGSTRDMLALEKLFRVLDDAVALRAAEIIERATLGRRRRRR